MAGVGRDNQHRIQDRNPEQNGRRSRYFQRLFATLVNECRRPRQSEALKIKSILQNKTSVTLPALPSSSRNKRVGAHLTVFSLEKLTLISNCVNQS
jgi:hypothetical protein